jgi:4-amino-4-deoxy-L-arabinose transferase-like glycosyltransferase
MTAAGVTVTPASRLRNATERFLGAGSDNAFVIRILALFVVAFTAFQTIAFSSVALHPDLTEIFAWSQRPTASYYKHPPLGALMAYGWFKVFPISDWSFHLLAMTNAAVGLFFVDLIARRYLDRDKRLFVLLFLLMTPFYQFHGQRFASNQTLLSTWPIATYCFLRAFESRGIVWPIAAGVAAALAMLGKYFSVYLIAAFPVAVLLHRDRMRYLLSPAPWISVASGLAVLSPHLLWLNANGPQTFNYAFSVHGNIGVGKALAKSASYFAGLIGYVALPCAVYWLAVRPSRATLRQAFLPDDPERRMLVALLLVPLILPAIMAPILKTSVTPLWSMQAWFLLPILLLAPPSAALSRRAAITTAICVFAATLVVLAAAPVLAWRYHAEGIGHSREYAHSLATELTREWRSRYGSRLSIVTGDEALAGATSFYSPDHPDFVFVAGLWTAPWVTTDRIAREGAAIVCRAADPAYCRQAVSILGVSEQTLQKTEITLARHFVGSTTRPEKFLIWLVPPADKPPAR